jgi:hypothetical protein
MLKAGDMHGYYWAILVLGFWSETSLLLNFVADPRSF